MRKFLTSIVGAALCLTHFVPVSAQINEPKLTNSIPVERIPEDSAEFNSIFNGMDLTGWDGDLSKWSVKDGLLRGETTEKNPADGNTFLIWKGGTTKNFELRLSFRCNTDNNSGIQYRSKHITQGVKNNWVVRGYQHELRNQNILPDVSGFIYDEGGKRGRICLVGERASWEPTGKKVHEVFLTPEQYKPIIKIDDWNDIVIRAKENRILHYTNGRLVLDFTDNDPNLALSEGILALQLHAGKPMWVEFKNIRIRDLKD